MKNLFTSIVVILLLSSCVTRKNVQLSDGSRITEKKYERIIDNSFEQGLSEVTEDDVKLLENTHSFDKFEKYKTVFSKSREVPENFREQTLYQ